MQAALSLRCSGGPYSVPNCFSIMVIHSLGVVDKPPGGAEKSAQNNPLAKVHFSLASDRVLGESRSCRRNEIPRFTPDCTARHWRALLFLGYVVSLNDKAYAPRPRCAIIGV